MAQVTDTAERPTSTRFTRGNKAAAKVRKPNQHSKELGPHSRVGRLLKLDLRTSEGLIVHRMRRELTEHCGGNPSVVQRTVIERCCFLQIRLALMDKKLADGHNLTEIDSNSYIAWSNALVRTMSRLGVEPKSNGTARSPILAELDDEP
jgi:hypothetical protein